MGKPPLTLFTASRIQATDITINTITCPKTQIIELGFLFPSAPYIFQKFRDFHEHIHFRADTSLIHVART